MDSALKAKLVEALRSGKYEQCRDELTDGIGAFCCIGVGYEVLGHSCAEINDSEDDPTFVAASAIGLSSVQRDELIKLNDGRGLPGSPNYSAPQPFPEIADYIEKNL